MLTIFSDEYFMDQAIEEAKRAAESGEVPVGAVVTCGESIIARAHNQVEILQDSTAHAELLAITAASAHLGSKWLSQCTLYVTLEPCLMCAGALFWARLGRIVYGASDDKRGFMRFGKTLLHPSSKLEFGTRHDQCASLLTQFFVTKR